MSLILCIGDGHTTPEKDNDHWRGIGKLIVERRPEKVVMMGDFCSFDSLSHWNASKKGNRMLEGKRYLAEIACANEALDYLLQPLLELQAYQREIHKQLYRPELVFITGNHDNWCTDYSNSNPEMHGFVAWEQQLQLRERGFRIIPDKGKYFSDGICFMHAPINAAGKQVAGNTAVRTALTLTNQSLVFAHTHRKEGICATRVGSHDLIQVLTVGCCFHGEAGEYVRGATTSEWRGVVLLHTWDTPGRFDVEEVSLERLAREYT